MKKLATLTALTMLAMAFGIGQAAAQQVCVQPPNNLVSWWPGDGDANDIIDANDPSSQSGVSFVAGKVGQGITLASGGFIDILDNANLKPTAFTIDAWVKPKAPSTSSDFVGDVVFQKARCLPCIAQASYHLSWSSTDEKWQVLLGFTDNTQFFHESSGTYAPDQFYHVAVTYDGTLRLYVDGVLDSSVVIDKTLLYSTEQAVIGANAKIFRDVGFPRSWQGVIDELEFFDRALTGPATNCGANPNNEICEIFLADSAGKCTLQACVAPPSGMVSWWPGDDNANDIAGGNDGTLQGDTMFMTGKVDQAFQFDGDGDYVDLGTTQIIGDNTSFTIDAWIRADNFDDKQNPIYGEYQSTTNNVKNYLAVGGVGPGFRLELAGRVFFDQFLPSGGWLASNTVLNPAQWYHLAYVQDGLTGTRSLYINGALDNADSGAIESYLGGLPDDIRIGMRGGSVTNQRFEGLIDEVEIFNRALSAQEIQDIFNAGSAGKCTAVVDIKPGSDPNSINCNNESEVIAVAILTTDEFDATTVDHTTVTFERASETHVNKKTGDPRRHEEDVDGDADTDLVFHFRLGDTALTCDSEEGTLTGVTFGGEAIEAIDAVRMVPAND